MRRTRALVPLLAAVTVPARYRHTGWMRAAPQGNAWPEHVLVGGDATWPFLFSPESA